MLLFGQGLRGGIVSLLILSIADILYLLAYLYIFALIIQAILSFITPPDQYNPISSFLYRLNEPLLRPIRRRVPPAGGFDFSVLIAIILIQLALILIVDPIYSLASR